VSTARSDLRWSLRTLRVVTYYLALLVLSTGVLLAFVASIYPSITRVAFVAFAVAIAGTLVLLAHQSLGWHAGASALCLSLAFVLPGLLIRSTPDSTSCRSVTGPPPCDPAINSHLGLRVGLMAALLGLALVLAVLGSARSSRAR
jgi:hypothetical protein